MQAAQLVYKQFMSQCRCLTLTRIFTNKLLSFNMSITVIFVTMFIIISKAMCQVCPKQCDCDMMESLYRAECVDQNIVSVNVGVPKEVEVYSLSRNVISELDNYCFKELGYSSIRILNLSYNFISWVGIHAFAGLDNLNHLDLSNNRLRYLTSDLFWDTPELEYLDLSGNVFETLKNEPFLMHNKLKVLNLNNCRMKSLPDRLFTRLPNLQQLDLSDNYMITLPVEVLQPLKKIKRLKLQNDYWHCTTEFLKLEDWILSRNIEYEMQCKKKLPKMFEKIISMQIEERKDVDINQVWNLTESANKTKSNTTNRKLTSFEKFDEEFPAFKAFLMGLEVGLAVGIVGTYLWLRNVCKCGHLRCKKPQTRRERRRVRLDGGLRTNLLWNPPNSEFDTPPPLRRQSLPDGGPLYPVYGLPGMVPLRLTGLRDRSESPPPPYHECRVNVS